MILNLQAVECYGAADMEKYLPEISSSAPMSLTAQATVLLNQTLNNEERLPAGNRIYPRDHLCLIVLKSFIKPPTVAHMDEKSALVASHKLLAELCDVSIMTVRRSLAVLSGLNFIQTVRIGSERGGVLGYIVNSRVAWADSRDNLKYASFSARVLLTSSEQTEPLDGPDLMQIPFLSSGDLQLPHGPGVAPPAQETIEGMLPDLPSIQQDDDQLLLP